MKFDLGTDPATGKRLTRYHAIKGTRKQAEAEAVKIIASAETGQYVDASRETVRTFVERWLSNWAAGNTSNKTYTRYEQLLRKHVVARIGDVLVQKLKPVHLQDVYAAMAREGLADRTRLHVHRVVHRMLRHAAQWGVVHQNAAALVDAPTVASKEIEILTPEQVRAVLATLRGKSIYVIAATALATGMRRSELLALRWQDVDLDGAKLRVEQSLEQTKRGGLVFKAPKTRHGRRTITLPPSTVTDLRTHWKTQQEGRLALGLGKAPEDSLVFAAWDGEPRSPNGLTKEWQSVMSKAKLKATLHSLRHTHASTLIASGLDVLTISRRLGHGSPAITLSVYGHLFKTDDRAAQIMEATFASTE
ncbi:MAG: tyrosine-type recombinase/integrase [Pseudorhodoplanes sp.]